MKISSTATVTMLLPALTQSFSPNPVFRTSSITFFAETNTMTLPVSFGCNTSHGAVRGDTRLYSTHAEYNHLLEDFKTADGEVVNPYRVLKVSRNAVRHEIRQSYRKLSKKYHPDGVRFRKILPGKCNNLDDVRDEWERINLSYDILTNRKLRLKYDRHTAIEDPAAAFGRFALNSIGWGVGEIAKGIGKGVFTVGEFAVHSLTKDQEEQRKNEKVEQELDEHLREGLMQIGDKFSAEGKTSSKPMLQGTSGK